MELQQIKQNLLGQICSSKWQGNPKTILVLDDDQAIYLLIQKLLSSCHDFTVVKKDHTEDLTAFFAEVNETLTLIIAQGNIYVELVADHLKQQAPNPCPRLICALDQDQDLPDVTIDPSLVSYW
jgi:CheY-like chemotaxis protein